MQKGCKKWSSTIVAEFQDFVGVNFANCQTMTSQHISEFVWTRTPVHALVWGTLFEWCPKGTFTTHVA